MPDISQNYTVGLPVAASTYAADVDRALRAVHADMAVIFAAGLLLFVYCLVRFRRGATPAPAPKGWLALVPSAVVLVSELVLIFSLGLPVWSRIKEQFPPASGSVVVNLT